MNIKDAIKKVVDKKSLTVPQTQSVFGQIMSGRATPAQIGAFITALRMKGETVDEITGAAKVMRNKAAKIKTKSSPASLVDTCGTGGTGTKTFNISTIVAFILAASGVKVAKHGNRAISSSCGSADVLEKAGVKIDVSAGVTARCIDKIGVGFLFAPVFHGAMRYASPPRKEIGIRTVFNMLGPLCNPLGARRQIIGVYEAKLTEPIAKVLKKLGSKRAYVVHGKGHLDEVSILGRTKITELKNNRIRTYYLSPKDFGMKKMRISSIKGGSAGKNAKIMKDILSGKKGPKRDIVLMNAAMALMASGKAKNIKEALRIAEKAVDSGNALKKLDQLVEMTNK